MFCKSEKQGLSASHAQESEHMQMSEGINNEARVVINFMEEVGFKLTQPVPVFEDNA